MNNRITWEPHGPGLYRGYVIREVHRVQAKTFLFEIAYLPEPWAYPSQAWNIRHRLPFQQIDRRFGTLRDAEQQAERHLVYAMLLLGFEPVRGEED